MDCFICKTGIKPKNLGEKCFDCDGCKRALCEKCSAETFSASEIRVLQMKKDIRLTYFCSYCRKELKEKKEFEKRISVVVQETIHRYVADIKEEISEMVKVKVEKIMEDFNYPTAMRQQMSEIVQEVSEIKTDIKGRSQPLCTTGSYADKLKKVDSHALVIRPRAGGDKGGTKTREEVKRIIDPSDLGIGVAKIKGVKDGIAVCCESGDDTQKLKNDVEMKLGREYEVSEVKKWKPRLKIVGVEEGLSGEELKECISRQNSNIGDISELEVKAVKKVKKGCIAIVEVNADLFKKILDCGRLKIKWRICDVYECLDVMRCFKCLGFNHKASDCKNIEGNKQVCSLCGNEGHREGDCTSDDLKCINCAKANEKLGLKLDVKHSAFDKKCTVLIRQVDRRRERIEYDK